MSEFHAPTSLTTIDKKGNRLWVYPKAIAGYFTNRRMVVSYLLVLIYLVTPWITINDLPAVQFNIIDRKFILFGSVYWPQDIKYLVFVLLGAGISLFLFTSVAGRIWCGWACPQTVFLEFVLRKIEFWIEGDRSKRMALDRAPWKTEKILKKGSKHLIFIVIAAIVANTFLAYFVGMDQVLQWVLQPPTQHWTAFIFVLANMGLFYFDFAWFREQFCTVVCPYARFQAALVDEQTMQITYDYTRGEPRGRYKKAEGDCIDCKVCVHVCPTGIDIRDGFQLECIGCARCIDACDGIMTKVNRPKGLIRYASEANLEKKEKRIVRPRVVIYSAILLVLVVSFFWAVAKRPLVEFNILRNPGTPYTLLQDSVVSNHFTLRLANKDQADHQITVKVEGIQDIQMIAPIHPFPIQANSLERMEIFVNVPQANLPTGKHPITIRLFSEDIEVAESSISLLGPALPSSTQ